MSADTVRVAAAVPATSANLGPGYDTFGLALQWYDTYQAEATFGTPGAPPSVSVAIEGEGGGGDLPTDERNLVARAALAGLSRWGGDRALTHLRLHCQNTIPHGRGMGSSSAAIVGGLALARQIARAEVDDADMVALGAEIEGHPDNVAPAVLGGFTISWTDAHGRGTAVSLTPHASITPVLAVPSFTLATATARSLLKDTVSRGDAVFNVARAALLTHALTAAPELLMTATDDRLHQQQRQPAYPGSHALTSILRMDGYPAVISGAGPTVLVLATGDAEAVCRDVADYTGVAWRVVPVPVANEGVRDVNPADLGN